MSRATVRAGVVNYLRNGNLPFVGTYFTAEPKIRQGPQFYTGSTVTGAILFPFINGDRETRISLGGEKRVQYDVIIHVECRSLQPRAEDAMADFDSLIEAIKVRVRADRTLAGTVFQAGEGNGVGAIDLVTAYRNPSTIGNGETLLWAAISMQVVEIITA